jgi:hypothetical protein
MTLCSVKDSVSRNNHPLSLHAVTDMLRTACPAKGVVHVICCVEDAFPLGPLGGALAKAFPLFNKKTVGRMSPDDPAGDQAHDHERVVHFTFLDDKGNVVKNQLQIDAAKAAAEGVRLACRLVGESSFGKFMFCIELTEAQ